MIVVTIIQMLKKNTFEIIMYFSEVLHSTHNFHITLNQFSWLFTSATMYIYQDEEINIGAALWTELQTLLGCHQYFHEYPFLCQDPIQDSTLHLVITFPQ